MTAPESTTAPAAETMPDDLARLGFDAAHVARRGAAAGLRAAEGRLRQIGRGHPDRPAAQQVAHNWGRRLHWCNRRLAELRELRRAELFRLAPGVDPDAPFRRYRDILAELVNALDPDTLSPAARLTVGEFRARQAADRAVGGKV